MSTDRFGGITEDDDERDRFGGAAETTVAEQIPRRLLKEARGVADAGFSMGKTLMAESGAGLAGIGATVVPGGRTGPEMIEHVRGMTGKATAPKTLEGTRNLQAVGETLKPISDFLENVALNAGEKTLAATDSPLAATVVHTLPDTLPELVGAGIPLMVGRSTRREMARLADVAESTPRSKELATKIVSPDGTVTHDRFAAMTLKQGWDEAAVASIKASSSTDKKKMLDMLNILHKGFDDATYRMTNRAEKVVGEGMKGRVKYLWREKRSAALELERVAEGLKTEYADYNPAMNKLVEDLDNMGIQVGIKKDGKLKVNFRGSDIEGKSAKKAQAVVLDIMDRLYDTDVPTAYDLHRIKKYVDNMVVFGKRKDGYLGDVEEVLKDFRHNIDAALDTKFTEYDRVNIKLRDTIEALKPLQRLVGSNVNLRGSHSDQALGRMIGKIDSRYTTAAGVLEMVENIEDVARKYGAEFDDDLVVQQMFASELFRRFPNARPTQSLGGHMASQGDQIERSMELAARRNMLETGLEASKWAYRKARRVDDEAAIVTMETLLDMSM